MEKNAMSNKCVYQSLPDSDIERRRNLSFDFSYPEFNVPKRLFESNPRLKVVIETCGKDGCLVWSREGCKLTSPAIPDGPIVDTVGAGDSFSAAFLSAILSGKTLAEAAIDGNVRAGKVASRAGAIPEDL